MSYYNKSKWYLFLLTIFGVLINIQISTHQGELFISSSSFLGFLTQKEVKAMPLPVDYYELQYGPTTHDPCGGYGSCPDGYWMRCIRDGSDCDTQFDCYWFDCDIN